MTCFGARNQGARLPSHTSWAELCLPSFAGILSRPGMGWAFAETESGTVCVSDPAQNVFGSAWEAVHLLSDKTQPWSGQIFF